MSFPIYGTSPLVWALALLVLLLLGWHAAPVALRGLAIAVEIVLIFLMTPLGANSLAHMVAARAPSPRSCPAPVPTTVVVLAGGFSYTPRVANDYGSLRLVTLQRVFAGVALWQHIPDARLVMSGGGGSGPIHEAVPMANLAVHMGVPASAIEIEDRSRNTWQNARNVAALSPALPRRIWLVTSAMSLPRALVAFRAWGFEPCAWPAGLPNPRAHLGWVGGFVPQGLSIRTASVALHEAIGGIEYQWLAWRHARHPHDAESHTP